MSFTDSLTNNVKTIRLKPDGTNYTVAAGTTDVDSEVVDTAGYDAVRFITAYGAIVSGAVTAQEVQQGTDATVTDAADLEGTRITVADTDDNKLVITDILQPRERYLRVQFDRGTQNATIDCLTAELYRCKEAVPLTKHSTVATQEIHTSPAEGTA